MPLSNVDGTQHTPTLTLIFYCMKLTSKHDFKDVSMEYILEASFVTAREWASLSLNILSTIITA